MSELEREDDEPGTGTAAPGTETAGDEPGTGDIETGLAPGHALVGSGGKDGGVPAGKGVAVTAPPPGGEDAPEKAAAGDAEVALPGLPDRPRPGELRAGIHDFRTHIEDGDGEPVVEFEGVTKRFETPEGQLQTALEDVHFSIPDIPGRGEFITLLGPSGCGKSTLLKMIAGLSPHHPPTAGTVRVRGETVGAPGPDRGMVFQTYSSFPCYTVLENVAFGLEVAGVPQEDREEKAREWVAKVRLTAHMNKYPHQLSGGMRQRVAIARSLIMKPRILLMDEPFGALDRPTRWEMQDLLVELWNQVEATVFLVTHDIAEAVYLGDRIFLMAASPGRLVEIIEVGVPSGNAAEAQESPRFARMVHEVGRRLSEVTLEP